jgi:hypothetical protein
MISATAIMLAAAAPAGAVAALHRAWRYGARPALAAAGWLLLALAPAPWRLLGADWVRAVALAGLATVLIGSLFLASKTGRGLARSRALPGSATAGPARG